jgi:hypothetical protein
MHCVSTVYALRKHCDADRVSTVYASCKHCDADRWQAFVQLLSEGLEYSVCGLMGTYLWHYHREEYSWHFETRYAPSTVLGAEGCYVVLLGPRGSTRGTGTSHPLHALGTHAMLGTGPQL